MPRAAKRQAGLGLFPIEKVEVSAHTIPTDFPESDGTIEWSATTIVIAEVTAGGMRGLGYTYGSGAAAKLIQDLLAGAILGLDAMAVAACWDTMVHSVRNVGRPGIASTAVSAVDIALWDLKARLLGLPLAKLLGSARASVPVYGSGGFTSYSTEQLEAQLGGWVERGISRVKMKVGRDPEADPIRVARARGAIGKEAELFVDANGAYTRHQALALAAAFAEQDVSWFEEPVTSDDLDGLRLLRDRSPPGMAIAAGEYGYVPVYFKRMLEAGAVDVLQADVTRCGGITAFLRVGALCEAWSLPLSAHTSPSAHLHACCAVPQLIHLEYFHDHARIEHMLFDGPETPEKGELKPDLSRPGLGIELKRADAARYAA